MENLELQCFQIISSVGSAKSSFIEAIHEAEKNCFDVAKQKMEEGTAFFQKGYEAHAKLIQLEAHGTVVNGSLLLMHAEDQLMSAETFKCMALELITCYQRIAKLESK